MSEYHKIQSVFKRDRNTHKFIMGDYSLPEFEYLSGNEWMFTEKVDGTNIRVIWDMQDVHFRGRTDRAQLPHELTEYLNNTFTREIFSELYPDIPMILYGEGYGKGIQKGGKYLDSQQFVLFDVLIRGFWLERDNVHDIADKLGIRVVPVIGTGTLDDAISTVQLGLRSIWGDFEAEGIVARPMCELMARNGKRIITKIKGRDF